MRWPATPAPVASAAMQGYLRRLVTSGLAYQAASLLASALALFTLPLYTRHLTPAEFGYAETLLTLVILTSILLRAGMGEAFVRLWFDEPDDERRTRLARTATSFVLVDDHARRCWPAWRSPGRCRELLLGTRDATLMAYGVLGLWAFTNLEMAYALLRVDERRRAYLPARPSANVLLTVALTVVARRRPRRGRARLRARQLRGLGAWCSSGCGWTASAAVSGSRRAVRRSARCCATAARRCPRTPPSSAQRRRPRVPAARREPGRGGRLRGGGQARDGGDHRGARLPGGVAAAGLLDDRGRRAGARLRPRHERVPGRRRRSWSPASTLLGRWVVRLLTAPDFFEAHEALPWVALGLGALRPLPRARDDRRPREGDDAHPPRGARRRSPSNARLLLVLVAAARHRGRGDRPVRLLRRDARRRAPADPPPLRRPVRMGRAGVVLIAGGLRSAGSWCCRPRVPAAADPPGRLARDPAALPASCAAEPGARCRRQSPAQVCEPSSGATAAASAVLCTPRRRGCAGAARSEPRPPRLCVGRGLAQALAALGRSVAVTWRQ